jgi:hypothetical protein
VPVTGARSSGCLAVEDLAGALVDVLRQGAVARIEEAWRLAFGGRAPFEQEWAPPGGTPRPVPACAADALRIKEGFQPHGGQVMVDGRPTDYWTAPAHYGPWVGGYFGGFGGGGLLSGLLVGSALGAGLGFGAEAIGDLFDDDDDGGDGDWDDNGGNWDDGDDFGDVGDGDW